ncbi:MAG: tRNA (N(6)-L-threonylcarbamoyladenosine(37)-C(2))-methylthiotransferase MtaB [Anaerosomatales bacterium]|nr:tRNA (N(6)-L-threonylcarbamoyladenosine(37)-C(2))-methylthiotransferase MtaB [Anaerosomatales bacterium]
MADRTRQRARPAPTVFVRTLGCKVNRTESEQIAAALIGEGAVLGPEEEASVVIINTCTVTGEADRKARKAVRHALGAASSPVVVVTGCLAALDAEGLESLGGRVVVEPDKERVGARVSALLDVQDSPRGAVVRHGEAFRIRAGVKVEDGCDAFCAYCIVPFARGTPRSVSLRNVLSEVRALVASGTAEVVLTGINIGRYSSDGRGLAGLVEAVAGTGVRRIRISSVEPLDLTEELLGVFAATPQLCRHLHVPLQSGSDAVLASMERGYTSEEYRKRIALVRDRIADVAITTDVMVGFPGESAQDFEDTLELTREIGFTRLHVFRYSKREGTAAAAMPFQVAPEESARRARVLRGQDRHLRATYAALRRGQEAELLVEEVSNGVAGRVAVGTTGDYLRASIGADDVAPGDLLRVRLGDEVCGVLVAERL